MLSGQRVYGVRLGDPNGTTLYIDTRTYQPMMTVTTDGPTKIVRRTLARKTLPATKQNIDLTHLGAAHPGARTLPAPPRIDELYGDATGGLLFLSRAGWRELILGMTAN